MESTWGQYLELLGFVLLLAGLHAVYLWYWIKFRLRRVPATWEAPSMCGAMVVFVCAAPVFMHYAKSGLGGIPGHLQFWVVFFAYGGVIYGGSYLRWKLGRHSLGKRLESEE